MTNRPARKLLVILIGTFVPLDLAAIVLMIVWLIWPYKTLELTGPILIDTPVHSGETAVYKFPYCKYTDIEATSQKTLTGPGGVTYFLPDVKGSLIRGCGVAVGHSVAIPADAPAGLYTINFTTSYRVNPFRTIVRHFSSNTFMVTTVSDMDTTVSGCQNAVTTSESAPGTAAVTNSQSATSAPAQAVSAASAQSEPKPGLRQRLKRAVNGLVSRLF